MKNLLSLFLLLVFVPISNGQTSKNSVQINLQNNDLKTNQLRQKTFDIVWNTINELYYDPTFGGINWSKLKEIYQPKAVNAASDDVFYSVLNQMINELKRSHLSVFSKNQIDKSNLCREGNIGLKVKIIENQPIVFQVESGSSAEKSGLKQGFVINQIDDELVSDIFRKAEVLFNQQQTPELFQKKSLETSISRRLCGNPNSTAKIVALNENSQLQTFQAVRQLSNQLTAQVGSLKKELIFTSKKLENNIGYIAFSNWDLQLQNKLEESIRNLLETKGIIIDLRGNSGGNLMLSNNLAGYFLDQKVTFGTFKHRSGGAAEVMVNPKQAQFKLAGKGKYGFEAVKYNYKGKIAVLVDYGSASTSEVFAAGLQESGRAIIVGERSFGGVLSNGLQTLPTGGLLSFPVSEYKTPKGIVLEGRGVEPDFSVYLNRKSLLAGRDLQLETAVKELLK